MFLPRDGLRETRALYTGAREGEWIVEPSWVGGAIGGDVEGEVWRVMSFLVSSSAGKASIGAIRDLAVGAGAADTDRLRLRVGVAGSRSCSVGREARGGSAGARELFARSSFRCWRSACSCFRIDF